MGRSSRFLVAVLAGFFMCSSLSNAAQTWGLPPTVLPAQPYTVTHPWDTGRGFFTKYHQGIDNNRWYDPAYRFTELPTGTTKSLWVRCPFGSFCAYERVKLQVRDTYVLNSVCDKAVACCYEGKEPVLFIHGYTLGTATITGGGQETWADFPRLIQESGYVPFEYRWNTGTRFEDAAIELEKMIDLIHEKTGERVHIVAHSFGGLLVRTML